MRNVGRLFCVVSAVLLLPVGALAQQPLSWQPTLDSARRVAAQTNRLVLIHFWADWCQACQKMDRDVFGQPNLAGAVDANYVPVKINADYFPTTCKQFGVTALPTDVVITPEGVLVDRFQGSVDAATYVARLNQVAAIAKRAVAEGYAQAPAVQPPLVADAAASAPQHPAGYQPVAMARPADSSYANPYAGQPPVAGAAANPTGFGPMADPGPPAPPEQPPAGISPQAPPQMASVGPMAGPGLAASPEQPSPEQPPAGNPELGLDGYCPVQLKDDLDANLSKWTLGDRRWGAIHRGRTYLFAGPEQQQRFLADPDRYAPVLSGDDVVVAVEQGQSVPGRREHGVTFGGQIYLFSSEASLEQFAKNPQAYAARILQAMRAQGYQQRPLR